jgi:hypothetical protein
MIAIFLLQLPMAAYSLLGYMQKFLNNVLGLRPLSGLYYVRFWDSETTI